MTIQKDRLIRTLYASSAFCAVAAFALILPRPARVAQPVPQPIEEASELPALCEAFGKLAQRHRQLAALVAEQAPECRPYLSDLRDAARSRR